MTVLAVLESTLPFYCLSCKMQDTEASVTVLVVSGVVAVSVMTATPFNLTPAFRYPDKVGGRMEDGAPLRLSLRTSQAQSCGVISYAHLDGC